MTKDLERRLAQMSGKSSSIDGRLDTMRTFGAGKDGASLPVHLPGKKSQSGGAAVSKLPEAKQTSRAKALPVVSKSKGLLESLTTPAKSGYFEGESFLPSSPQAFAKGLGYHAERAGAGLLGAVEGVTDFVGSSASGIAAELTSLGGQLNNPVSDWLRNQSESFLNTSPTQSWKNSINERYQPSIGTQHLGDITETVAQMLPALAVGNIVSASAPAIGAANAASKGANASKLFFGLQAAGSGAQQAASEGASTGQALTYGALSGLLETSIESLAGGIPGLGKGVLSEVANKVASNPLVTRALDIVGEGGEEALSTIITPYIQRAVYNSDAKNATADEIAESAIMGMVAAGVLQGGIELPTAVSQVMDTRRSVGTNQDIVNRANQRLSSPGQVMSDFVDAGLPLPTASQVGESTAKGTASTKKTGTYRAEQPQNVDLPTVPIINLSMDSVAKLNDGTLPKSGNYLRKQAYSDTVSRLGLDKNEAAYVEAENITRNGDRYVIKITKPSLKKMLSASSYPDRVVPLESIAVLSQLERIAQNGVYYRSEGDRKGRPQVAGYDHLLTTVYLDGMPYVVDMRVRVEDAQAGGSNRLYHFTPEHLSVQRQKDGAESTAGRHATGVHSKDTTPSFDSIISDTSENGNLNSAQISPESTADSGFDYAKKASYVLSNGIFTGEYQRAFENTGLSYADLNSALTRVSRNDIDSSDPAISAVMSVPDGTYTQQYGPESSVGAALTPPTTTGTPITPSCWGTP